ALQFHGQDLFHAASELRVNQSLLGLKAATVLLVEPGPAKRAKLFIEKRPADSRNLLGVNFETEPVGVVILPSTIVKAPAAEGCGQDNQPPSRNGQHRSDRSIQIGRYT